MGVIGPAKQGDVLSQYRDRVVPWQPVGFRCVKIEDRRDRRRAGKPRAEKPHAANLDRLWQAGGRAGDDLRVLKPQLGPVVGHERGAAGKHPQGRQRFAGTRPAGDDQRAPV